MMELRQRLLHRNEMADGGQASVLAPILERKGDIRNYNALREIKLLELLSRLLKEYWKEELDK